MKSDLRMAFRFAAFWRSKVRSRHLTTEKQANGEKELPMEIWAVVLGELENIRDFARIQLVSKSFQALVLENCWTKVKRIAICGVNSSKDNKDRIQLVISTAIPWQTVLLPLPLRQSAKLLEKLVRKATKTTDVVLDLLRWVLDEKHDQVLTKLFDALAQIKVKDLEFRYVNLDPNCPRLTCLRALARFLNANAKSLTTLRVTYLFDKDEGIRPQVLEAFRNCRALDNVEIYHTSSLVESILNGKMLKSLELFDDTQNSAMALLRSGVSLRQFTCENATIKAYIDEVEERNLTLSHPLRSLQELKIGLLRGKLLIPWALFPSLKVLTCSYNFKMEDVAGLARSFLKHWVGAEKAFELRIRGIKKGRLPLNLEELAAVQTACGCHATVSQTKTGGQDSLGFHKGDVILKVLTGEMTDVPNYRSILR